MKYALLIYEDEGLYGPDKSGPKIAEIVGKHMTFAQELGAKRLRSQIPELLREDRLMAGV